MLSADFPNLFAQERERKDGGTAHEKSRIPLADSDSSVKDIKVLEFCLLSLRNSEVAGKMALRR